ncbi:hypothetical protein A2U01_0097107, partial [Trifolium medium]|nr:hypothetical protein [Trifolium medium]
MYVRELDMNVRGS